MSKRTRILFFILIIVLISSIAIGAYDQAKSQKHESKEDLYTQVELFASAIGIIRSDYVDEVESKKLIYGALKGMLSSLDDFSQFMEPDEYKEITMETKGEFGGVGIEISRREGVLTVVAPIAGTPAEKAGIQPGDKIVRINGKITKDMTLNEAVKMMRGEAGSSLTLTIWREKEEKIFEVPIKRDTIKIHSVKKAEILKENIGYVKLIEFQEKTPRDLEAALKKLESEGMNSLILDLRNNPGGLLETAIDVSEKFLPKDTTIVSIKSRTPEQNALFKSSGKFTHPSYPLIILVNEGSASGSEIVAGAVQDNKRGIILGTKTFGKASVQTVLPLRDGSALRLTTAAYFTPNGKLIKNQGIIPDVIVERSDADRGLKEGKIDIFEKLEEEKELKIPPKKEMVESDSQLDRAIDLMKAIKIYGLEKNSG